MAKQAAYLKYQVMTAKEVAECMGNITTRGVDVLTHSAIRKLRRSPSLFLSFIEGLEGRRTNNIGSLYSDEV